MALPSHSSVFMHSFAQHWLPATQDSFGIFSSRISRILWTVRLPIFLCYHKCTHLFAYKCVLGGVYIDEENDPISAHLFSLEGEKWKNLRAKLTPTFTNSKMRAICSTLLDCQSPLMKHMEKVANSNETVEVRELTACYTTNVIASVAFGIDIDCLADPETPFRKYGRQVFGWSLKNAFRYWQSY